MFLLFRAIVKFSSTNRLFNKENDETFQYIGLNIKHSNEGIFLSQEKYANDLYQISTAAARLQRPRDELSSTERDSLREIAGQLNWLAT